MRLSEINTELELQKAFDSARYYFTGGTLCVDLDGDLLTYATSSQTVVLFSEGSRKLMSIKEIRLVERMKRICGVHFTPVFDDITVDDVIMALVAVREYLQAGKIGTGDVFICNILNFEIEDVPVSILKTSLKIFRLNKPLLDEFTKDPLWLGTSAWWKGSSTISLQDAIAPRVDFINYLIAELEEGTAYGMNLLVD